MAVSELKKEKRGAELTLNVIVIAAIVLFVMVILLLIFTGRIGTVNKEIAKCENKGGTCTLGACPPETRELASYTCDLNGDADFTTTADDGLCCVGV